ncbi:hypothetical protein [Cupriavidus basilensis]|uniref:hypothetical protein n=1 Tax=Cupriavidus basilensis TaxID=68895 RepID=UPI0020A6282B|nr:hypothetical protein [Cupriavidus basilensis]MCP3017480.1 hypothetical protein [Cupriavidus basilensis]
MKGLVFVAAALVAGAAMADCEKPNLAALKKLPKSVLLMECSQPDYEYKALKLKTQPIAYAKGMSSNNATMYTHYDRQLADLNSKMDVCFAAKQAVVAEMQRRKVAEADWPAACSLD